MLRDLSRKGGSIREQHHQTPIVVLRHHRLPDAMLLLPAGRRSRRRVRARAAAVARVARLGRTRPDWLSLCRGFNCDPRSARVDCRPVGTRLLLRTCDVPPSPKLQKQCRHCAAAAAPHRTWHIRPAGCSSAAGATGAVVGAAPAALGLHGTLLAGEPGESDGGVGEEVTALDRIRQYHE